MQLFCSGCVFNSEYRGQLIHIFDPTVLKFKRQLRQLEEEREELAHAKQRDVAIQITAIDKKIREIRKRIKARQVGTKV